MDHFKTIPIWTAQPQGLNMKKAAKAVAEWWPRMQTAYQMTGELMTTASDVAAAASPYLAMLGLSRPAQAPVASDYRLMPFNLTQSDAEDTCARLGMYHDSNMTIDGRELGTTGEDETNINYISGIECLLQRTTWEFDNVIGTFKFGALVTPVSGRITTVSDSPTTGLHTYEMMMHTPVSHVASAFKYWRGDMVYKIKVAASRFNKGRLRIWYEPYTKFAAADGSPEYNVVNSAILDLAETDEIIYRVPWNNARDALRTDVQTGFGFQRSTTLPNTLETIVNSATSFRPFNGVANGYIVVEVLQELTSSSAVVEPVSLFLFSWAENITFYSPQAPPVCWMDENAVRYSPAADEDVQVTIGALREITRFTAASDFDVSGGECAQTLRQLLKRYTTALASQFLVLPGASRRQQTAFPAHMEGFTVGSLSECQYEVTDGVGNPQFGANFQAWTPESWFRPCYALVRGSVRKKIIVQNHRGTLDGHHLSAQRYSGALGAFTATGSRVRDYPRTFGPTNTNAVAQYASRRIEETQESWEGMQLGQWNATSGVLDFELPHTSQFRAFPTRLVTSSVGANSYGTDRDEMNFVVTLDVVGDTVEDTPYAYQILSAVGEDYGLYEYLHAPCYFVNELPVAVA